MGLHTSEPAAPAFRVNQPVRVRLGKPAGRLGVVSGFLSDGRVMVRLSAGWTHHAAPGELEAIRPGVLPAPSRVTLPAPAAPSPRRLNLAAVTALAGTLVLWAGLAIVVAAWRSEGQGQGALPPANACEVAK